MNLEEVNEPSKIVSLKVARHAHLLLGQPVIDSCSKLLLVLGLLVPAPRLFPISLLLSDALIFRLERLQHRILLLSCLVLKHASHSSNDCSLLGVSFFFVFLRLNAVQVLMRLLFNPCLLLGSLKCDTLLVKQIFTFKLQTS